MFRYVLSLLVAWLMALPAAATTVLYTGDTLVSDTQVTYHYAQEAGIKAKQVEGYSIKKMYLVRRYLVGCSGSVQDINKFLVWLNCKGTFPFNGDFECIVIGQAGAYVYNGKSHPHRVFAPIALGSGGKYALHAYLLGYTPMQAVHYAEKKDKWSGGTIDLVKIDSHKRIE